jgi:hypothetical protein
MPAVYKALAGLTTAICLNNVFWHVTEPSTSTTSEMVTISHAFLLWHEQRTTGRVRIACDNQAVVDGSQQTLYQRTHTSSTSNNSPDSETFDIEVTIFRIPSEENIVADASSRHNFRKLADLGSQDQIDALQHLRPKSRMATLRQRLHTYFKCH